MCSTNDILQGIFFWKFWIFFWHRKLTLKVRIVHNLTTFTQVTPRLKNFLVGWLLVLGLKEGLVECAKVCFKSWVLLMYCDALFCHSLLNISLVKTNAFSLLYFNNPSNLIDLFGCKIWNFITNPYLLPANNIRATCAQLHICCAEN